MTRVADIEGIRWMHFREGKGVREVARSLHVSRKTVRKALADPGPWSYRKRGEQAARVMEPVAAVVRGWMEEDLTRPRKQRHTAHRMYDRLVAEYGFAGGESTVRSWVRRHRPTGRGVVTLPLAHDPGAEAQMDFGEARVVIGGIEQTVQLFCARLAHSTRDVVVAYSHQDRSCWLDGHVRAFATWGGVPRTVWYDNPSQLGRIVDGTFRPCDDFVALQSAYGFRAHHCTPAQGHEKGLVEGLVGYIRRNYLVPIPEVASLDELNERLGRATRREEARRRQGQTLTVGERFREEQALLGPIPVIPYIPCTRDPVRATHQLLVTVRKRQYSVPLRHAGAKLWARIFAEHIEIWDQTQCVARHERHDGLGDPICDFWHYLPVLQRSPGAFANAYPVRQAQFPQEARDLLTALEKQWSPDKRRAHKEFLAVCALVADTEFMRWRAACATALARDTVSAEGVRSALMGEPVTSMAMVLPARVHDMVVPAGDVAQYAQLLEASA